MYSTWPALGIGVATVTLVGHTPYNLKPVICQIQQICCAYKLRRSLNLVIFVLISKNNTS